MPIFKFAPDVMFYDRGALIGRPYEYMPNTDPKGRVFTKHMLPASSVVMIRPGKIRFSKDINDFVASALNTFRGTSYDGDEVGKMLQRSPDAEGNGTTGSIFDNAYGVKDSDQKAIDAAIAEKRKGLGVTDFANNNSKSIRYFEFDSSDTARREYFDVMTTLSSRVFSRMKRPSSGTSLTSFEGVLFNTANSEMINGGFFPFWAENSTSVSETASNEVGQTQLAGLVKGISNISREASFVFGRDLGMDKGKSDSMVNDAVAAVADFVGGSNTTGLRASLGDAILGMNPMFPEVWKDSSFNRSYNLSFKFSTPYGSPGAIYRDVLQPFLMLLSLVIPIERNPGSYSQPFVFQLDCPGRFSCNLGICTDFSFVKGGSDGLWGIDNLPRQIDVTMTVRDLYPVLTGSRNTEALYFNQSLGSFLDTLSGVSLFRSGDGQGDLLQRLQARIASVVTSARTIDDRAIASLQRMAEGAGIIPQSTAQDVMEWQGSNRGTIKSVADRFG